MDREISRSILYCPSFSLYLSILSHPLEATWFRHTCPISIQRFNAERAKLFGFLEHLSRAKGEEQGEGSSGLLLIWEKTFAKIEARGREKRMIGLHVFIVICKSNKPRNVKAEDVVDDEEYYMFTSL